jgi:fermentation-respiration switch protein FrsA (DUF1100 family)
MPSTLWTVAGAYALFAAGMYAFQRRLLYVPQPFGSADPASHGTDLQEIVGQAHDGVSVHHWLNPAAQRERVGLVVFHGNAGNLEMSAEKFLGFADDGRAVVLSNYRGYSGAAGRPTEAGLYADARALLDRLEESGYPASRLVLYGESLGSGVATRLASERQVAGLVLEAPFTSIAAVAQRKYWYLPAYWLTRDRFDNLSRIGRVEAPVLILHGERDRVIPVSHAHRLARAAKRPCELFVFPDAGHADLYEHGAMDRIRAFLQLADTSLRGPDGEAGASGQVGSP